MATKKKQDSGSGFGGLALAAAAAAGIYFLYGSKDAQKNRKAVKGWALKLKGEVLEKIEAVKGELTEENYHKIVDSVAAKYKDRKEEVEDLKKDLKSHWKSIKKHVGGTQTEAKKAVTSVKKTVKKVVKKGLK